MRSTKLVLLLGRNFSLGLDINQKLINDDGIVPVLSRVPMKDLSQRFYGLKACTDGISKRRL